MIVNEKFKLTYLDELETQSRKNLIQLDLSIKLAKLRHRKKIDKLKKSKTFKKLGKFEEEQYEKKLQDYKELIEVNKDTIKLVLEEKDAIY
ncbi:MAG TPA: hypothetical protein PKU78_06050 [Candidatus Dojkabacteria bacterium]|nr:hypothetical protein [Candidatus Dojkabacteria bacterium]HRO65758.1 hypothetical protein [Candidatus Dojkabacteria bacterium]HRP50776.1 hypothetical protein [Candidatus Dojkabacteria bacterium]